MNPDRLELGDAILFQLLSYSQITDPTPSIQKLNNHYGCEFDHDEFADAMHAHKARWLLSSGDHPCIRELYADYTIETPEWRYGGKRGKRKSSELLIRNY